MEKKAYEIVVKQPSIKFPWHVGRYFADNSRQIDFSGEELSFGEDYGTLDQVRTAVEWLVDQLGGTVKWKKQNTK